MGLITRAMGHQCVSHRVLRIVTIIYPFQGKSLGSSSFPGVGLAHGANPTPGSKYVCPSGKTAMRILFFLQWMTTIGRKGKTYCILPLSVTSIGQNTTTHFIFSVWATCYGHNGVTYPISGQPIMSSPSGHAQTVRHHGIHRHRLPFSPKGMFSYSPGLGRGPFLGPTLGNGAARGAFPEGDV